MSLCFGIVYVFVLAACDIRSNGSAEGYGGGDGDFQVLESTRSTAAQTIRRMVAGQVTDSICEIPICIGAGCAALSALSDEQVDFLARLLTHPGYSSALIAFLENASTFKLVDEPIFVDGVEVDAAAELRGSKVWVNRTRMRARSDMDLMILVVHESMHLARFPFDTDGVLTDSEVVSVEGAPLFSSGRFLADLAGACVQGHEERERILGVIKDDKSLPSLPPELLDAATASPVPPPAQTVPSISTPAPVPPAVTGGQTITLPSGEQVTLPQLPPLPPGFVPPPGFVLPPYPK